MNTNFIAFAARAKGPFALLKRVRSIAKRYGFTPAKMDQALRLFAQILRQFECGATFPITTVALKRNSNTIAKYANQNIEFVVHGYTHVDYSQLASEEQLAHLLRAREIFADNDIAALGFRSPYLRRGPNLYAAIKTAGFSYVSNQPIMWDVLDAGDLAPATHAGYERAMAFYTPWHASERLSLPRFEDQLIRIPVSLPDDEILLDRLGGANGLIEKAWLRILSQTHQRGELFTLQLHPERIAGCADALSAVLAQARTLAPSVWIARLDEIAHWWRERARASVEIKVAGDKELDLAVTGPDGVTVLARDVTVEAPTRPWSDRYQQVEATQFTLRASSWPIIGLAPTASPRLAEFLRQQGYIVETNLHSQRYSYYFDQAEFTVEQERPLLAQIKATNRPLIRLGRWPDGARSALAITGDIDALTLWDYCLRLVGK